MRLRDRKSGVIYSPNSIAHGSGLLGAKRETLLTLELERLKDFVDFLFDHSEHCDHISQSEAWNEFEIYEIKNSFYADNIRAKRKLNRPSVCDSEEGNILLQEDRNE